MQGFDSVTPAKLIPVHLYMTHGFMAGNLQTRQPRLSDALDATEDQLELRDVVVIPYANPAARQTHSRAIVSIRKIYFASDRPGGEYQPVGGSRSSPRTPQQVTVGCGPFAINGSIHLPAGGDIAARFSSQQMRFVPLTQVTIRSAHFREVSEAVVLVNQRHIDYVFI